MKKPQLKENNVRYMLGKIPNTRKNKLTIEITIVAILKPLSCVGEEGL